MKTPLQKLIFHYKQETMSAEKLQKIAQEVEQEQGYGGTASGLYADIWMEAYRRLEANQDKVLDVPKRWTDEAMLAEWMHDTYEEIAAGEGWETQKDCKVLFDDLPEKNKAVMLKVAGKLLDEGFNDPDLLNQDNDWKRVGELANEITKIVRNETN